MRCSMNVIKLLGKKVKNSFMRMNEPQAAVTAFVILAALAVAVAV
jgi:hypothetical protein